MNRVKALMAVFTLLALYVPLGCLRLADFEPGCDVTSDCSAGQMCHESKCVAPNTVACTSHYDCDTDFGCINAVCAVKPVGYCEDRYNCGSNQFCRNNLCSSVCLSDADCQSISSIYLCDLPTGQCYY